MLRCWLVLLPAACTEPHVLHVCTDGSARAGGGEKKILCGHI